MKPVDTIEAAERRFNSLIDRHRMMIRNLCWYRAFMRDEFYCADLIQRCYISLWRHLPELRADASPKQEKAWVAWRCRSVISQRVQHRPPDWLPIDRALVDTVPDDRHHADVRETLEDLASGLNERERRYLQLNNEGYNADEIARQLQTTAQAVYKLRQRVIDKMRETNNRNNNTSNDKTL